MRAEFNSSRFSVLGSQFSTAMPHGGRRFTVSDGEMFRCHTPREGVDVRILSEDHMGESYRDLIAWRKAMELVTEIYGSTRAFPQDERYGLTNQLRRAAVSVPSNIAEGQARFSRKEFHHFLSHARGSLVEIETQLMIAQNLGYLPTKQVKALLDRTTELGRVLNGLIASIKSAA